MAAMMVVRFLLMIGPNHGFMGSHQANAPKVEATHMLTAHAGKPQSIETPEAWQPLDLAQRVRGRPPAA